MNVIFALVGGLLFSLALYTYVLHSLMKKKKLELLEWFLLAIGTFNGIVFGFVIWATSIGRNPFSLSGWFIQFDTYNVSMFFLLNFVLSLSVFFGWHFSVSTTRKRRMEKKYKPQYIYKKLILTAWVSFLLAFIAYALYTRPYGGFIGILDYSRAIRSGVVGISNPFSFLKPFGSLAFFSSFIFFGALIDKKQKFVQKKIILLGFILSFLFSIYVLYQRQGRLSIVSFLVIFILALVLYNYKSILTFIRKIIGILISSILLIIVADFLLEQSGKELGIIELFAKELSFPFVSYIFQFNYGEYNWFKDILIAPVFILPQRIWSGVFNIETTSSLNTLQILGARKGEAGVTGEIPIDMVTFGLMQGSILGIVVVGILFGYILHKISVRINLIPIKSIRSIIFATVVIKVVILSVFYGDPEQIISRNFDLITGLLLSILFIKFTLRKRVS